MLYPIAWARFARPRTEIRDACRGDALNLAALSIQVWMHSYAIEGVRTEISRHVFSTYTEKHYCDLLADPSYRILVSVNRDN